MLVWISQCIWGGDGQVIMKKMSGWCNLFFNKLNTSWSGHGDVHSICSAPLLQYEDSAHSLNTSSLGEPGPTSFILSFVALCIIACESL